MTGLSIRLLLCTTAVMAWGAAAAAEPLPTPPGAKPILELSVSDADLLPAIKQALPAAAAILSERLGEFGKLPIELAEVEAIFRDIQSVEAVYFAMPAGPPPPVAQFYQGDLIEQGWRRLFWMEPAGETGPQILIMAPEAEPGLFGVVASPCRAGQQRTAVVFRIRGEINIAPIVGLAVGFWTRTAAPSKTAPAEAPPAPANE